jgi:hypothetical protein
MNPDTAAVAAGQSFQFLIKTLTGKQFFLENVSPHDTIATLKERICQREGIPPNQQKLVAGGKGLEDERTVGDYVFLQNGVTIHLVLRLTCSCPNCTYWPIPKFGAPCRPHQRRVLREIRDIQAMSQGVRLLPPSDPNPEAIYYIQVQGPPGSIYQDGLFTLIFQFPDDYPFKPFRFGCLTKKKIPFRFIIFFSFFFFFSISLFPHCSPFTTRVEIRGPLFHPLFPKAKNEYTFYFTFYQEGVMLKQDSWRYSSLSDFLFLFLSSLHRFS